MIAMLTGSISLDNTWNYLGFDTYHSVTKNLLNEEYVSFSSGIFTVLKPCKVKVMLFASYSNTNYSAEATVRLNNSTLLTTGTIWGVNRGTNNYKETTLNLSIGDKIGAYVKTSVYSGLYATFILTIEN